MSLFDTIKKAIFYNPLARGGGQAQTSADRSKQANATTAATNARSQPAAIDRTQTKQAAPAAPSTGSPGTSAQAAPVDVAAVLEALNAKSAQKLNWRTSIVDLMKLVDLDPTLENRRQLAQELGYQGSTSDTASMNIWLHKQVMRKLAENGGKVPADLQD